MTIGMLEIVIESRLNQVFTDNIITNFYSNAKLNATLYAWGNHLKNSALPRIDHNTFGWTCDGSRYPTTLGTINGALI